MRARATISFILRTLDLTVLRANGKKWVAHYFLRETVPERYSTNIWTLYISEISSAREAGKRRGKRKGIRVMTEIMSTADLKLLLKKRRRNKIEQDNEIEREELLREIRELENRISESNSSASSEST